MKPHFREGRCDSRSSNARALLFLITPGWLETSMRCSRGKAAQGMLGSALAAWSSDRAHLCLQSGAHRLRAKPHPMPQIRSFFLYFLRFLFTPRAREPVPPSAPFTPCTPLPGKPPGGSPCCPARCPFVPASRLGACRTKLYLKNSQCCGFFALNLQLSSG